MRTYKGKISIARYSGTHSGINIELDDEISGVKVVSIDLTPEQFGNALSGLGYTDCMYKLYKSTYIGMKRESKTELIPCANPFNIEDDEIRVIISDYEVDGWIGRDDDFKNHHNFNSKNQTVKVAFVRWVDAND